MDKRQQSVLTAIAVLLFLVLIWTNSPSGLRQWFWIVGLSISFFVIGHVQAKLFCCDPNRLYVLWGSSALVAAIASYCFGNLVTALMLGCCFFLLAYLVAGHSSNSVRQFRQYWWVINAAISILLIFLTPDVNRISLTLKDVAVPTHFSWQKEVTDSRSKRLCTVKYFVNFSVDKETFTLCSPGIRTARDDMYIRVAVNRESGLNILSISYSAVVGIIPFQFLRLRKTDLHVIDAALPHQRELIDHRPVRVLVLPITTEDPVWLKIPFPEKVRPTIVMFLAVLFAWQLVCFGFLKLCPLYGRPTLVVD